MDKWLTLSLHFPFTPFTFQVYFIRNELLFKKYIVMVNKSVGMSSAYAGENSTHNLSSQSIHSILDYIHHYRIGQWPPLRLSLIDMFHWWHGRYTRRDYIAWTVRVVGVYGGETYALGTNIIKTPSTSGQSFTLYKLVHTRGYISPVGLIYSSLAGCHFRVNLDGNLEVGQ